MLQLDKEDEAKAPPSPSHTPTLLSTGLAFLNKQTPVRQIPSFFEQVDSDKFLYGCHLNLLCACNL